MKFYVKVLRKDGSEVLGNMDGQGFYEYASLENLHRYQTNRYGKLLNNTLYTPFKGREFDLEFYEVRGNIYDESKHVKVDFIANRKPKPPEAITLASDGITVEGHRGKWYVLEEVIFVGKSYFLLEHETYGEDADHIAVDSTGYNIFSHITDGADEILERLIEREEESDEMKEQRAWFTEVSYKKAIEIFEAGSAVEVYCLYDDGSEGLVETAERIEEHYEGGGRFGIE